MTQKVTLAEVAAEAGVSKMTASRALRRAKDVSPASLKKVQEAAAKIGYLANPLAASLSSKRTQLVGVAVPSLTNTVFAEVLTGIAEVIEGSGLQPVFGVTNYDPDTEAEIIRNMLSWRPAGLIVTGLDQPDATLDLLRNFSEPVVQVMDTDGLVIDNCVGISHRQAGADMALALLKQGRRRIGYVNCTNNYDIRAIKRLQGFREELQRQGRDLVGMKCVDAPSSIPAGRALTADLLGSFPDLDAVYYSNDDLAAGGVFHCLSAGITVPETLYLAGFNGLEYVDSLPVAIATTRTPRHEIGRGAAQMVLDDQSGKTRVLQTEIHLPPPK